MEQVDYASRIKVIRDNRGWSQKQMADALGVEQGTISRLERGEWEPSKPVQILLENMADKGSADA